jgi:hypothetical protein
MRGWAGGARGRGDNPGDPGAEAGEGALQTSRASGGDWSKLKSGRGSASAGSKSGVWSRGSSAWGGSGRREGWRPTGPLQDHYYRTAAGHVIRGRSHEVPVTVPDQPYRFLAVSSPEQLTPSVTYPPPKLFINRSFLALRARAPARRRCR